MATVEDKQIVRAQARWVHSSARKARLVTDLIRGRSVPEARTILAFSNRAVAKDVEKVLRSAVANAESRPDLHWSGDTLVIAAVYADEGPTLAIRCVFFWAPTTTYCSSAAAVRDGIATLQKVFLLRTCENTVFANRSRPCMLHQIGRCTAPCVGLIGEAEYRDDVDGAALFLRGKAGEVLTRLSAQMEAAAAKLEFERAARIRDKIGRLQQLQSRQFVESATAGDIDVVAAASERGLFAVNVVMIRGGRHVGDKTFFPRHAEAADPTAFGEIVPVFLEQHYVERPVPPTIVVPDADDHAALAEVLSAQAEQKIEIVGNPGGERRVWLAMALQNATLAIRQKLAQKATQEDRLAALQEALGLPPSAQRIECFDVSHTMGEAAVASCVIFDRLAMQSGEYRRFNVTPDQGGDDYAAMREALTRRCARIVAGEYPAPDLLVIDGGRGQVAVAANVLEEQGMHGVPLIGIAKGPERKAGEEDIVFPDRDDVLNLPSDHPGLHLLQQIRDEAHRFAVQGHRARRAKTRTTSALQEIAGIGAAKRRALLAALRRGQGRAGGECRRHRARARYFADAG